MNPLSTHWLIIDPLDGPRGSTSTIMRTLVIEEEEHLKEGMTATKTDREAENKFSRKTEKKKYTFINREITVSESDLQTE